MNIDEFNANRDRLEPIVGAAQTDEEVYGLSAAASLKRIADSLERIADGLWGTPERTGILTYLDLIAGR